MRRESAGARMAEAIAGKGAARLVEHELRASVKHDVKSDCLKKKEGAEELNSRSLCRPTMRSMTSPRSLR